MQYNATQYNEYIFIMLQGGNFSVPAAAYKEENEKKKIVGNNIQTKLQAALQ